MIAERQALVRRGLLLNYGTLVYNCLEGLLSIGAGLVLVAAGRLLRL